jgi:serine/threonine protein kinase
MEFCPPRIINFAQAEKDLKESLKKLHYLQIVHCDIKSDNIRYSPSQNKWVYIDFGLHKTIKENIGEKSFTDFRGTLGYCGK